MAFNGQPPQLHRAGQGPTPGRGVQRLPVRAPSAGPGRGLPGSGRGGRNQEFALAGAEPLAHAGGEAVLASVGTDGIDGPTDAAGAIADATTLERARRANLSPIQFLNDNNSYAFFAALDDLVRTGPTGTNVGDLQVILLA